MTPVKEGSTAKGLPTHRLRTAGPEGASGLRRKGLVTPGGLSRNEAKTLACQLLEDTSCCLCLASVAWHTWLCCFPCYNCSEIQRHEYIAKLIGCRGFSKIWCRLLYIMATFPTLTNNKIEQNSCVLQKQIQCACVISTLCNYINWVCLKVYFRS